MCMISKNKKYRKSNILLIGLTAFLLLSCLNASNPVCQSAKELMEKSVDAINNKNTKGYISLIYFDSVLAIWENAARIDDDYKEMASTLKNDQDKVIKSYSRSYNMLIGTLERIHNLDEWHFEIKEFELDTTEYEPGYLVENYIMKLEDNRNNHNQWSLRIYLAKYEDCYYITEPIDPCNLKKGWK